MAQILTNETRERLNRIAMVKPEKARGVEDLLIQSARKGQLRGKVTETQLIELLEQAQSNSSASKIVVSPI